VEGTGLHRATVDDERLTAYWNSGLLRRWPGTKLTSSTFVYLLGEGGSPGTIGNRACPPLRRFISSPRCEGTWFAKVVARICAHRLRALAVDMRLASGKSRR
jgi:hypothetical protein